MEKKKILYVHQVSSVGGASFCLLSIIKELDRKKYLPSVLLKSEGPLADEFRKLDVEVFFLSQLCAIPYNKSFLEVKTWINYWKVHKCRKLFHSFLLEYKFDLVYLNNMMLYPYLKEIDNSKTIVHVREHWPLDEHIFQLRRAQKYVSRYATRVVAINHYSASMFADCSDRTDIVYDWIDMSSRHRAMSFDNIFGEDVSLKKVYLFTGGTNWTKGPKTVVDVFVNHLKGDDKRLLILGMKPLPSKQSLKMKIKGIMKLFGYKDPNEELHKLVNSDRRIKCIPSFYEIADLMQKAYCNLSFFVIPHANLAMAESIIMGTPCVAAKTEESIEYSKNGELAVLFELGNKEAFIDAINYVDKTYSNLNNKIKENSLEIESLFSPTRNINVLNHVYSKILE